MGVAGLVLLLSHLLFHHQFITKLLGSTNYQFTYFVTFKQCNIILKVSSFIQSFVYKKGIRIEITNQILYFVESQGFKINYNLFHPIKNKNKTEWAENNDNPYSKKTHEQHAKNCRKLWDSAKGKEIRKSLKNSKGKIPITFKGELNPLFDL